MSICESISSCKISGIRDNLMEAAKAVGITITVARETICKTGSAESRAADCPAARSVQTMKSSK